MKRIQPRNEAGGEGSEGSGQHEENDDAQKSHEGEIGFNGICGYFSEKYFSQNTQQGWPQKTIESSVTPLKQITSAFIKTLRTHSDVINIASSFIDLFLALLLRALRLRTKKEPRKSRDNIQQAVPWLACMHACLTSRSWPRLFHF